MDKQVPIYITSKKVTLPLLASLQHFPLERTVDNKPVNSVVNFLIAISNEHLFFGGYWDKIFVKEPEDQTGLFIEGLWESHVLELFLADSDSDDYLEINLSPSGAWWGAQFSGYRQREALLDESRGEVLVDKNSIYLKYPVGQLSLESAIDNARANVTAINMISDGKQYQSWNWVAQQEPDFHDPRLFAKLFVDEV